ncbi:transposase [Gordonia sp. DT218]|uniref:transposase n=1 Tax=Gordonia sp. DT218 TaxID=3416659 RepID=UPI003CF5C1D2
MDTEIAGLKVPLGGGSHVAEASVVHDRAQSRCSASSDRFRSIAEVARDLGLNDGLLGRWVADERRRLGAASQTGQEPLTAAERDELARLRRQVAEQEKDIAFLKKASAYFAANHQR